MRRYARFGPYLLAWWSVLFAALRLKQVVVSAPGGGYGLLAQATGLLHTADLPASARIALYWQDLLVFGVLLPLLWLVILPLLHPRIRGWLTGTVAFATAVVLWILTKSFWEVHTFPSLLSLIAGLSEGGLEYLPDYVHMGDLLRLAVLLFFPLLVALAGTRLETLPGRAHAAVWLALSAPLIAMGLGFGASVAQRKALASNSFTTAGARVALGAFVTGLWTRSTGPGGDTAQGTDDLAVLAQRFRAATATPLRDTPSMYTAKASGFDVVIIALETAPFACVGNFEDSVAFPNFSALRHHAFIGAQHYSTYPYTIRALFSIYGGWYPGNASDVLDEALRRYGSAEVPGLINTLKDQGYRTAVFSPEVADDPAHEAKRYAALGFSSVVRPDNPSRPTTSHDDSVDVRRERRRTADTLTVRLLERELESGKLREGPIAVAFQPQLSHGPWPGAGATTDSTSICRPGKSIFAQEDAWVGRIVDALRKRGSLQRTILVVTGDHGLRTHVEYPSMSEVGLDDISFHVPLLISAPGVLEHPVEVPWITSHIDIGPTILDLLGIGAGTRFEQGAPVFDARLQKRTTFVFGRQYLGTDAFIAGDTVNSFRYGFPLAIRTVSNGGRTITASKITAPEPLASDSIERRIDAVAGLQYRLIPFMAPPAAHTAKQAPASLH